MKKLFTAAMAALTITASAFAAETKNEKNVVSSFVLGSFKAAFKNASDIKWTTGEGYLKASFTQNSQKMEAFYSPDGSLIAQSSTIGLDELPVSAKRTFAKRYSGYTVKEAIYFEGTEENAYYISAENEKQSVILKVGDDDSFSIFKKTQK